ncbi:hypothetical protein C1646_764478 [Rhizophagus diaphanus]|nr:hypothetical protein C1646_764478 [Rhizophagus diaphanus] [Rhizophagus sp. MUCL 43196]
MTDTISINCLIIPCGRLSGVTIDQVTPIVSVGRRSAVSALEAAIQSRSVTPFNNVRLDIPKADADLDSDYPDKEFFATWGKSGEPEADDSDSEESIDSNHLIHYESSDEESQNETSASSPNSDTDYDESDVKREEESKNETPQITDEEILAALGISEDIRTEADLGEP